MPEYLDATKVTWVKNLPTVESTVPTIVSTPSRVVDLLEQHTVRVVDKNGDPGISLVLGADIIFGDDK